MLPVSVDQPWHVSVASSWSQFSWLDKFWKSQYFLCRIPLFMSEHKPSTKSKERLSTSGEEEKPFPLLWRFQWTQRHLLEVEEVQNQHVSSWSWLTWTERHYNLARAAEFILGEKRTFQMDNHRSSNQTCKVEWPGGLRGGHRKVNLKDSETMTSKIP